MRTFWNRLTPLGKGVAITLVCLNVALIVIGGWQGFGVALGLDGAAALYVFAGPET